MNVEFEHIKCPLHRFTFRVKPIKKWVEKECEGLVLNLFCGPTRLDVEEIRNDIDGSMDADYHMDAVDFIYFWKDNSGVRFNTVILDPPYSYRKSMEMYKNNRNSRFKIAKDHLRDVMCTGSKVITFGYHSVSMGEGRGFIVEKVCLFSHGGAIHDTIACVERDIGYDIHR